MRTHYDVLILGAGAAGLAAARILARSGRRVAVIEARDRIGGRIFTRHVTGPLTGTTIPVELGAEFVHGLPVETWTLIREAGLETYELDGCALAYADRLQRRQWENSQMSVLAEMSAWLLRQPEGTDETFADYLSHTAMDGERRAQAVRYVEGFNAADHRIIGVAALARQQEAEDRIAADRIFHVRAGYDALPLFLRDELLSAGGTLFLDKPVGRVEWQTGAVTMRGIDSDGRDFEFEGAQAVITLPLGVLLAGSVRFSPGPPHLAAEMARMAMGTAVRVPLIFRSRFWCETVTLERHRELAAALEQLSFVLTDRTVPTTWWTPHPNETPMLVGWSAGPNAMGLGSAAPIDQCVIALADVFDVPAPFLREQLIAGYFHDWSADPFSRGAYSYAPAGALSASANIAEPVAGTLYFAGEHASVTGHWGTVHGALQSGEAAAARIITP